MDARAPSPPLTVRVRRGGRTESRHRCAVAIVGPDGLEASFGDQDPVFWRSAAKPLQAAAGLAAGVVERFELSPAHVAVMCASHNGEPRHVALVRELLAKADLDEGALQCGAHPSISPKVAASYAARGETPTRVHSNCSGKHAGMLLLSRALGAPVADYLSPDHPSQRAIGATIRAVAELPDDPANGLETAVDGCSAPTFALPLDRLATAFRNLAQPEHLPRRAADLARIRDAMTAEPWLVAGTGRFDTDLMTAGRGRIVSKIGAEGVAAVGLVGPAGQGVGIAVKVEDGTARAYEALLVALLRQRGALDDAAAAALASYGPRPLRNFAGLETGTVEVDLP